MNDLRLRIVAGDHIATDGLSDIEVACLPDDYTVPPLDLIDCNTEANARRIVACVNYCKGLPTEGVITATALGKTAEVSLHQLADAITQRDQLLAALERMVAIHDEPSGFAGKYGKALDAAIDAQAVKIDAALESARAAIAAVKGGAA